MLANLIIWLIELSSFLSTTISIILITSFVISSVIYKLNPNNQKIEEYTRSFRKRSLLKWILALIILVVLPSRFLILLIQVL